MELQRPGATPTLPQWDLGIVLEAPLREPSFRHFTLKTVFLLTMFSVGRRSELLALRFDQNCIQFKPNGAGVTPYFSQPEFGAPNCPVRALRYYRRYLTEHPGLRKGRRRLFP